MNDKLLIAFIKANGFDIERTLNITYGQTIKARAWGCASASNKEFEFFPATVDMPTAEYREVIRTNDYKVTKNGYKWDKIREVIITKLESDGFNSESDFNDVHSELLDTVKVIMGEIFYGDNRIHNL